MYSDEDIDEEKEEFEFKDKLELNSYDDEMN
jgi:hypothetical protein